MIFNLSPVYRLGNVVGNLDTGSDTVRESVGELVSDIGFLCGVPPPNVVLSCTSSVSLIVVVGVNAIFARKSCRRVWQERHNQSNNLVSQSESFTCQIDVKEVE